MKKLLWSLLSIGLFFVFSCGDKELIHEERLPELYNKSWMPYAFMVNGADSSGALHSGSYLYFSRPNYVPGKEPADDAMIYIEYITYLGNNSAQHHYAKLFIQDRILEFYQPAMEEGLGLNLKGIIRWNISQLTESQFALTSDDATDQIEIKFQ